MADKCTLCNYNTKQKSSYKDQRVLRGKVYSWQRVYLTNICKIPNVSETSLLCAKCRTKLLKVKQQVTSAISEADGNILIERSDRDIDM